MLLRLAPAAPRSTLLIVGGMLALPAIWCVSVVREQLRAPVTISSAPLVTMPAVTASPAAQLNRDIDFYATRLRQDPRSALDHVALASLLLTRSRTTTSNADLRAAEEHARASVALRRHRNAHASEVLASVLMARHAFREALAVAATADSLDPGTPALIALIGEIELECGDYAAAATRFRTLSFARDQFSIAARVARWHELSGRSAEARALLVQAIRAVDRRDDLPREQVAWFHYRLGELELRLGRNDAADAALTRALDINPDDPRALGGLSRVATARRDWRAAIAFGERAIGVQFDPATLGTISTAHAALGDSLQSARYADAMTRSALQQPGAIHRAWGLFILDHGATSARRDVLRRARAELRDRRDIYGYDLYAWALYRDGQRAAARRAMASALMQGTEDVLLTAHASAIVSGSDMNRAPMTRGTSRREPPR